MKARQHFRAPLPPMPTRAVRAAAALTALLAAGTALALGACGGGDGARPNLVLVSIDTLRPDHLGCYGYERETSPAIDRLASEGVRFSDASSTTPWTLPSHASLLTGLYPSRHGVKSHDVSLADSIETLATRLYREGWATMAVVNSHNLSQRYGLDQGYERFEYVSEWSDIDSPDRFLQNKFDEIVEIAEGWLEERDERPFFLFLHTYDVHTDFRAEPEYERMFAGPYRGPIDGTTMQLVEARDAGLELPPRDVRRLLDLYDAEIRQMDDTLGGLLGYLDRAGLAENTYFVLVSDHGEEFMEHGSLLHGRTYFQEVIAIPMLFRGPGVPAGMVVDEPVSLVDTTPTLLALLGRSPSGELDGADLSPLWRRSPDAPRSRFLFAEADHKIRIDGEQRDDVLRMVRIENHKLIHDRVRERSELFDLAADPQEREDLAPGDAERVELLMERVRAFLAVEESGEPIEPLSEDEIEMLRATGYF